MQTLNLDRHMTDRGYAVHALQLVLNLYMSIISHIEPVRRADKSELGVERNAYDNEPHQDIQCLDGNKTVHMQLNAKEADPSLCFMTGVWCPVI